MGLNLLVFLCVFSAVTGPFVHCNEPPAKRPRVVQCLVSQHIGIKTIDTQCSNETTTEFRKLSDLANDRRGNLNGAKNMADLILSRIGVFEQIDLAELHICDAHYNELGPQWSWTPTTIRRSDGFHKPKCAISDSRILPIHGQVLAAPRRFLQKTESLAIWRETGVFVPLGTPVCPRHGKMAKSLVPIGAAVGNSQGQQPSADDDDDATDQVSIVGDPDWAEEDSDDDSGRPNAGDPNEVTKKTQKLILQIGRLNRVSNLHVSENFVQRPYSTQIRRAGAVGRLFGVIYKTLAPDAPDGLRGLVEKNLAKKTWFRRHSKEFVELAENVADAYMNASTKNERFHVLSIVAPLLTFDEMQSYVPEITEYTFKKARLFAKIKHENSPEPQCSNIRVRYDEKKVQSFIDFITNPHMVSDLPFGQVSLKTTSGMKVEVANLVRNMVNERIVKQYYAFLKETQQKGLKMCRSTLLRLLKICQAKTRKTMSGLDYFTFNGVESIDALLQLVQKMKTKDGDVDFEKDASAGLREAKIYLKSTYKLYIQRDEAAPARDHCIEYALSDPSQAEFQATGHVHEHDARCYQCEALSKTLENIKDKINEITWSTVKEKTIALHEWRTSSTAIQEWKKHVVRSVNQELAKNHVLENLKANEVFLHLDWAMKFLPLQGRESQTEWFVKAGISWHVAVAFIRTSGQNYYYRTFIHVFDKAAQGSQDMVAIIFDTLKRIRSERPDINKAYLRSDNAGCYKSSETILSVKAINDEQPIKIARWDFSEAQAGKGVCDRTAAVVKRKVRLYAAENHKCTTGDEFVRCANSYEGISGVTFIHGGLEPPPRDSETRYNIPSISQYFNFEFDENHMTVWRAYDIGTGKRLEYTNTPESLPKVEVFSVYTTGREIFRKRAGSTVQERLNLNRASLEAWRSVLGQSMPGQTQTCPTRHDPTIFPEDERCPSPRNNFLPPDDRLDEETTEAESKKLFHCPEEACVMSYQYEKNLARHLRIGNHVYRAERQTMRDFAINQYQKHIDRMMLFSNIPTIASAIASTETIEREAAAAASTALSVGWALRTARSNKRFTTQQKQYLIGKFNDGIVTGRKHTPQDVAAQMRDDFPNQDDWLTWSQIQSFFSREARRRVQNLPPIEAFEVEEPEDDADEDPLMNAVDIHINAVIQAVRADRAQRLAQAANTAAAAATAAPELEEEDMLFED